MLARMEIMIAAKAALLKKKLPVYRRRILKYGLNRLLDKDATQWNHKNRFFTDIASPFICNELLPASSLGKKKFVSFPNTSPFQ